jgi:murein DD-endopeptidase MepM/ murein hydrolase activator NlpD
MNGAPQQQLNQGTGSWQTKKNDRKRHIASFLKCCIPFLLLAVSLNGVAQYSKKELRQLRKGKLGIDTSFVYQLPFEPGTAHFMVQGYYGWFSHDNRLALDFKLNRGTKVCAARGGVVVRVRENGKKGGLKKKYRSEGNNIVIQHSDGSRAGYWHLQFEGALVNVGDTVKQGQVIGLSGKTGYASAPHLHFLVWTFDNNRQWQQVPTRFITQKGVRYLRVFRKYRSKKISEQPAG